MKIKPSIKKKKPGIRKLPKDTETLYLFNFEITFDDDFNPHGFEINDEIADAVNTYREHCNENPAKAAKDLPAIIERFPQVPQLRNHLFVALRRLRRHEEAWAINDRALKDHPGYIYAVINKAVQFWEKDELDEVEKLFGGNPLTINLAFPKREKFHAAEVFAYYAFLIRFWTTKGNQVAAESHYEFLEELGPGHPQLPELKKLLEVSSLKDVFGKLMQNIEKSKERSMNRKPSKKAEKPGKKDDPKQGDLFKK